MFSPRRIDPGTKAMIERVVMIDLDPEAVSLARRNAGLNGVPDIAVARGDGLAATRVTGFTKIRCNPPYHVDFAVPKKFIEKGFNRLAIGGHIYFVTKRRRWYENKLRSIFGGVSVFEDGSYFVMEAERRRQSYANT